MDRRLLLLIGSVALAAGITLLVRTNTKPDEDEMPDQMPFAVGERWSYQTRPGEEHSSFVVGRIDETPSGRIVHVRVDEVEMRGPLPQSVLPHVPMQEGALVGSRRERREVGVVPGEQFERGYSTWRDHQGGPFAVPLAEVVALVEMTLDR